MPVVSTGGVVNGASFAQGQPVAPGSIVSVFGASIAANTPDAAVALPLPTLLGGATVTVGGVAAPLYYSSGGQLNAQIPVELAPNNSLPLLIQINQESNRAISIPERP